MVLPNLADLEGGESVESAMLGTAESVRACAAAGRAGVGCNPRLRACVRAQVSEEKVGDGELIYIRGCKTTRATSIVLRGANEFMLDEMVRDGLMA